MPANNGRELKILRGIVPIAGVRTKTVSINGDAIDVTSDDDLGYRTLLNDPATRTLDLKVEGITKDDNLRAVLLSGGSQMLTDITIEYPDGSTITGNFYLAQVEETGAYDDAITFSTTLQSSGEYTYTPAI